MHTIVFKEKQEVAEETFLYTFSRPDRYMFEAGQYATIRLPETMPYKDDRGNARAFSFASAPYEKDLGFMMRQSESGFKKNIHTLRAGDEAQLFNAIGKCTLGTFQKAKPLVMICAGVGYTPVRSILRQMIHENLVFPVVIINSNRTPRSAPEYEWLLDVGEKYNHISIMNTMTDLPEGEEGHFDCRGRIDEKMIMTYAPDTPGTMYFVVAGADFIASMREIFSNMGIPEERVYFDNFG